MRSQKIEEVFETKRQQKGSDLWVQPAAWGGKSNKTAPARLPAVLCKEGPAGLCESRRLTAPRMRARGAGCVRGLCAALQRLRLEEPPDSGCVCWNGRGTGGREETRLQFLRPLALSSS